MAIIVPRRSALYLPASNARAIEKVRQLDVDVVIFDLEDSVSVENKALARKQACDAVRKGEFGQRELVIRINGAGSPWYDDDLTAVLQAAPHGILLPKVESAQAVLDVAERMMTRDALEHCYIWCMLETPRGVLAANEILQCHHKLAAAVLGTSDLTKALGAQHTPGRLPLMTAMGLCLLAARANGLAILDGVCLDLEDESHFREACVQGRQMGFDGKTLIHPSQIDSCNAAFSPSPAELTDAQQLIAAFTEARELGKGVVIIGGRLVEELHVAEAQRVLALHEAVTPKRPV